MMLRGNNSSSQDQDQNFEGHHFKKIQYNGSAFDSDNIDSINDDSISDQQSRKIAKEAKRSASNKEVEPQQKSKAIKKNRQSAKMSRLRKKQYQQKLQQTVNELQSEIGERKINIKNVTDKIFNKFERSNKLVSITLQKKYKYLIQKISISKTLLNLFNQIKKLKQPTVKDNKMEQQVFIQNQLNKYQNSLKLQASPSTGNNHHVEGINGDNNNKQQQNRTKVKKRKGEDQIEEQKNGMQQKINQKQTLLSMTIKAYMYQFGARGCLRGDVLQRSKFQWLQNLKSANIQPTQQICKSVRNMKNHLQRLDNKTKLIDHHLRELQSKVKDKYSIQFMLDRYFFVNNSTDTIYKNSQLKNENK